MESRDPVAAEDAVDPQNIKAFNALMQTFMAANKVTGWTPSPDASVRLELADNTIMDFASLLHEPRLVVQVRLAPLPSESDARMALYGWLLFQNATIPPETRLTIDEAEGYALCRRHLPFAGLDAAKLQAAAAELLGQADALRQMDLPQLIAFDLDD